ncbi:MAG: 8-amino-7-oxononanoate synthase [Phycisphaerae bacterium]|nr:8-amino-7-oxononanoate synthase [Phycisphaerae bacterium]
MTFPHDHDAEGRFDWLRLRLDELADADLIRRPFTVESAQGPVLTVVDDAGRRRELLNFCSNNYLNLAADPRVIAAARDAVERWGVGSGASRLISGTTSPHRQAEAALADFMGADDALLLSTGYMANVAVATALAGRGDTVLLDKLDHASLIDAARQCGARLRTYPHGDVDRLADLLARADGTGRRFVLTDSLFSMDGDFAPLREIAALKSRHPFTLIVDEAHAIGVFGRTGRGVAELLEVSDAVDVTVGTCSKSLGGAGGFVAGDRVLIDALRNTARPFVYSTAPPAAAAAAVVAAVEIVRSEPQRRGRLLAAAASLRAMLAEAGWDVSPSVSQIIPIAWGGASRAMEAQRVLLDRGVLAAAIRPPTVPRGTSRLRLSVMDGLPPDAPTRLLDALSAARERGVGAK